MKKKLTAKHLKSFIDEVPNAIAVSRLKKGDTVTWTSQASGMKKKKTGRVVEMVAAGAWFKTKVSFHQWNRMGQPRNHRSYIVDVNGKLYWPLVKNLKLK